MAVCQPCGTEIIGQDRFCRNCGAPVPTLVEDLVDTHRFNPTASSAAPSQHDFTNPFSAPPSDAYPMAQVSSASYQTGPVGKKLMKKLMRRNAVWLLSFLLLFLFIGAGATIGRSAFRSFRAERARRAAWARQGAERARQSAQARQAEAARRAFEQAIRNALGFMPANVSEAEYPGLQGVFVASLTSDDSPAAAARIQAGDVLTQLGDQAVRNSAELGQVLNSLQPGAEVGVKFYRDGETVAARIKPANPALAPFQPQTEPRNEGFLGVGNVSRRCCIPGGPKWGLEVRRIIDNSPADLFGLQLGDVITEFDKHPMRTPDELSRRIRAANPRSKVTLKFYRGNTKQTVELVMGHGW